MSETNKKIYFVKGMHCASCEVVIENEVVKIEGVNKANVSLKKSLIEIHTTNGNFPKVSDLNSIFTDLGYTFHNERLSEKNLNSSDIKKVTAVFLIFLTLFFMLERSGILMSFTVNSNSSLASYFLFGLMASFSSCAALIGGILLTMSGRWNSIFNNNLKKSSKPFIFFNVARLISFAVFGAILGIIGNSLKISITASSILTMFATLVMIFIGFQMLGVSRLKSLAFSTPKAISGYLNKQSYMEGKYIPLLIGALTFFIPCGFTLIAQTNSLSAGSPIRSSLMLTSFALGTLPMLALISFSSVKLLSNPKFSKQFSLFSGMLIVFFGLYTFNSQLNTLGLFSLSDISKILVNNNSSSDNSPAKIENEIQYAEMIVKGFSYSPRLITLRSGIKTELTIYNQGASGCAQAVYSKGLFPSVVNLKPGINKVEFTSPKPGSYKISCSMGMVQPITVNVY